MKIFKVVSKSLLILSILITIIVFLNLWAIKPSVAIIGEWKPVKNVDGILNFYKDGTFTINPKTLNTKNSPDIMLFGSFQLLGDDKIKLSIDGPKEFEELNEIIDKGPFVTDIKIENNHFVMTSLQNVEQEYEKVSDSSFDDIIRNIINQCLTFN